MELDLSQLADGDLLEAAFVVEGLRVEVLAEVKISGTTLHLRDIAIYPAGIARPSGCQRSWRSPAPNCSAQRAAPASMRSGSPVLA